MAQKPVAPSTSGTSGWSKNSAVITALIGLIGVLATSYWQFVYKPAHESPKGVRLAFFVKERGSAKPIPNAQVILQRPTRQEERQTDNLGTARFEVDPDKERSLHVRVYAVGYQDGAEEVDAPQNDGSYDIYLDAQPTNGKTPPPETKENDADKVAKPPQTVQIENTTWRGSSGAEVTFEHGGKVIFSDSSTATGTWELKGNDLRFDRDGLIMFDMHISGDRMAGESYRKNDPNQRGGSALRRVH